MTLALPPLGSGYRFNVTKTFSDGITDEVEVTLTCNSGLPLEQSFTIAGGDPAGVTFVVTDIPEPVRIVQLPKVAALMATRLC